MRCSSVRVEVGRSVAWISGPGSIVMPALKSTRAIRQWDGNRRAWSVPADSLDDVLCALEFQFGADIDLVDTVGDRR